MVLVHPLGATQVHILGWDTRIHQQHDIDQVLPAHHSMVASKSSQLHSMHSTFLSQQGDHAHCNAIRPTVLIFVLEMYHLCLKKRWVNCPHSTRRVLAVLAKLHAKSGSSEATGDVTICSSIPVTSR